MWIFSDTIYSIDYHQKHSSFQYLIFSTVLRSKQYSGSFELLLFKKIPFSYAVLADKRVNNKININPVAISLRRDTFFISHSPLLEIIRIMP
jgi:hypothetical protein